MISPILPAHDADLVALDFGVFIAEQARTHRVSQTAIIAALRPCILPSQPEAPSNANAPASQTDGGVISSLASSSVEPKADACPNDPDGVHFVGCGCDHDSPDEPIPEAPKPLPDAPDNPADALVQPAEAKTSEPADGGAVSAVKSKARLENAAGVEPPPSQPGADKPADEPASSPAQSREDQLRALFDGNQPTCKEATEALGLNSAGATAKLAKKLGLTFRKVTPEEFKAKVSAGMARRAEEQRAKVQKTTKALQGAPAPSEPMLPPVVKPRAPTGRFYLVERGDPTDTRRYVHQSLAPDPSGTGPMMTTDRRWAWFNDITKFRGARQQWPQLATMRKEAASK